MIPHHVIQDIEQKIVAGFSPIQGKTIVHTAPHHDDILLGYFPYLVRNLHGNTHHVVYMTSGANGVSDQYLAQYSLMTREQVAQLDSDTKQELKFRIREAESEKKWAILSASEHVTINHFRAQFYQADEQGMDAALQKDVQRMVDYLNAVQPDIITMLVDPVDIGPATHHRSAKVIAAALAQLNFVKKITVLGYRNVWSTFTLDEASMIVLVSQEESEQMESMFANCFPTQINMLIAGDELKNFAQEVTHIHKAQYDLVQRAIGRSYQNYQAALFLQQLNL